MTHLDFERISELADSVEPTPASRDARHLAECAECRDTFHRVCALLASTHALPRDVAPPPEVWTGIRARLKQGGVVRPRGPVRRTLPWLAAAAVVVFAVGGALLVPRGPGKAVKPVPTSAAVASVERQYAPVIQELRTTLDVQRPKLANTTVTIVDQSLAAIDTAIAETRDALASDPDNQSLADILSSHYERKVEFMQRATELVAPSL